MDIKYDVPDDLALAFSDLEKQVLALFNPLPVQDQPRYIADLGCRHAGLLKQLFISIREKTRRGESLATFPLTLIGIADDTAALRATREALQDLPHLGLSAAGKSPEQLLPELNAMGVDETARILFIHCLLDDHDGDFGQWDLGATAADVIDEPAARHWMTVRHRSLECWRAMINAPGLLVLARHVAPGQMPKRCRGEIGVTYSDASSASGSDAETFLVQAANAGLFAKTQPISYPETGPVCCLSLSHFEQRDYRIRHADERDLAALERLEQQCWPVALQTPGAQLAARLKAYPEGQFVLTLNAQIVGVIYSQRIASVELLLDVSADTAGRLHRQDGAVVQLIAVNILPAMQHRKLGDQLLEFMLQRCSLMHGVDSVVAVTLCKDYPKHRDMPLHDYIHKRNEQGRRVDPVLRFHELHGGRIEGLLAGYRPLDKSNDGNGVLASYDIHRRRRDDGSPMPLNSTLQPLLPQDVGAFVAATIKACLGEGNAGAFSKERALLEMGLDSADLLQLGEQIGFHYRIKLEPAFFFEYSTAEKICAYIEGQMSVDAVMPDETAAPFIDADDEITMADHSAEEDIAIIGLSGRYPKAGNLEVFWENLKNAVDCITEIPKERWDYRHYYDPNKSKSGKIHCKWGGFIDGVDEFDSLFFNISPREAESMDPQERLFLQTVWHTFEDAGYNRLSLKQAFGGKVGVFVGVMYGEYPLLCNAGYKPDEANVPFSFYGSIANRVSFQFDFHGPSMAIDTLCSSSLTALHQAVVSIKRGECAAAIVGGVNLSLHPNKYRLHSQLTMSSSDGRCRSFGAGGDGFVPGEGVGALLIKPLRKALADGDHIYGVVKGTAINHDGKTYGYTVPNPNAQADMIVAALKEAKIDPRMVSYVEAHGTGTPLGDPVEIAGLNKVFGAAEAETPFCALGSVKSNIGHLEAAAGIVGLTKILLQMQHKQRVPSLHSETLNSNINFTNSPFYVQRTLTAWRRLRVEHKAYPRIACISSFGAGGANAHAVLAEYDGGKALNLSEGERVIIVLSAKTPLKLKEVAENLLAFIRTHKASVLNLRDLAYTLQVGRDAMEERFGFIAGSIEELEQKLGLFAAGREDDGFYRGSVRHDAVSRAAEPWADGPGEREYAELPARWVNGQLIDWRGLYRGIVPSRMSLPLYPFAGERFPLPNAGSGAAAIGEEASAFAGELHPFLQQNISTLFEQRYRSIFTGQEFFLADHSIHGNKILPGVAYLEMARAAMGQAAGGQGAQSGVRLKNIVWTRPIIVDGEAREVHIRLSAEENDRIHYEILTVDKDRQPVSHSHGAAILAGAEVVPSLEIATLRDKFNGRRFSAEHCYEIFETMGFDYGPAYRGIESLYAGDGEVLAKLAMPASGLAAQRRFVLHPCMMDAALQASLGLMFEDDKQAPLKPLVPFELAELAVFAPCAASMWAWVRHSDGSTPSVQRLDIDLSDDNGQVCVQLKGFAARALEAEPAGDSGTLICLPAWQATAADSGLRTYDYARHRVLLCDLEPCVVEEVEAQLQGARCLRLYSDAAGPDQRYRDVALQVFACLKELSADKIEGYSLVQILIGSEGLQAGFSGLSGLLKTAHAENPKWLGQVIEVEGGESAQALIDVLRDNSLRPQDAQIRYHRGQRQVPVWEEPPVDAAVAGMPWKDRGVYLITGGAGGLGLIFAEEIVMQVKDARLILTGRLPLNAGQQARINALGDGVEYRRVDVSAADEVEKLMQWIQASAGQLQGILHAAGAIHDHFIANKTPEEFAEVLSAKVSGLVNLDQATKDCNLDFFVCFSSLSGVVGNPGQADYAAANAFMDAYADYRRQWVLANQRTGHTLSINWPLWRDGGMRIDEAGATLLKERKGWLAMPTADGLQAFYQGLATGCPQVLVMSGMPARIRQQLPAIARNVVTVRPTYTGAETGALFERIQQVLLQIVAEVLKIKAEQLDANSELQRYGFDSIRMTEFSLQLNRLYQLDLTPGLLLDYPTIAGLAKFLAEEQAALFEQALAERSSEQAATGGDSPRLNRRSARFIDASIALPADADAIAIVGISGRFPMADDLHAFWENIKAGRDCITEIPEDRWDWQAVPEALSVAGRSSTNRWGGFISGVKEFDPAFFNMAPRDAQYLDPQLRLLLIHLWQALEDAAIAPKTLAQDPTGVFVAAASGEYSRLAAEAYSQAEDFISLFTSAMPNRISQLFDLNGPSECYETACSSSLVAIHRAVQAIHQQECAQAVVAAVNLLLTPARYIASEALGYLSPDGQARSFQAGANGFVRAEGVGAMIIKPLRKALEDGDRIYALIKGTGIAHGGKGLSLTAPNPVGMKAAMVQAYRAAGIAPGAVSYIEAHGVAATLSDAQEINALKSGYRELTIGADSGQPVYIGSLKPCIGHGEVVSGMAAVFKVILAMRHQLIPGIPRFSALHEQVSLDGSPFQISGDNRPWPAMTDSGGRPLPRRASINGYGDAGVNGHVVLEEFIDTRRIEKAPPPPYLVVLSAQNDDRLTAAAGNLRKFLLTGQSQLADLAYTLQIGRKPMASRLALIVETQQQLLQGLKAYLNAAENAGHIETLIPIFTGHAETDEAERAALYSGLSESQWLQAMLTARDFKQLAAYWTLGGDIPWATLYQGLQVRRLALPTYPFRMRTYWLDESENKAPAAKTAKTPQQLPPFVADGVADGGDLTAYLKQAVAEILGFGDEPFPAGQSLDQLGFTSLHALTLKSRLEQAFGVEIPLAALDVYLSPADLANGLNRRLASLPSLAGKPELPVIMVNRSERDQPFPLSDIQESFWLGRKLGNVEQRVGCHVYLEIEITGLDIYRLNRAWNRLLDVHEMLRAIVSADGQQQILAETPTYSFIALDLRRKNAEVRTEQLKAIRELMSHKVYQADVWPLFEIRISVCPDSKAVIHFSIDELIVDASAVELLFEHWQKLYDDPDAELPKPELSFRDYMLAIKQFEVSNRYRSDLQYWLAKLQNMPEGPVLPPGARTAAGQHCHCVRWSGGLDAAQWQLLKQQAQKLKASPTALLLTIFAELLRSRNEHERFALVLTFFNRLPLHRQIEQVLGPFISTTLFVAEAAVGQTLEQAVRRVQESLLADLDHSSVSGIKVLRELKKNNQAAAGLSLPVVFTSLLGKKIDRDGNSFLEQVSFSVTQTPQVYLDHQIVELNGVLRFSWDVVQDYFAPGFIDGLFSDYCRLLSRLADNPGAWRESSVTCAQDSRQAGSVYLPFVKFPAQRGQTYALSDLQQAYAFGKSRYGADTSSQIYSHLTVANLDVGRLEAAWQKLLAVHDMLASVIEPDGTRKLLEEIPRYRIKVNDFRSAGPERIEEAIGAVERSMMARNCPLGDWPYFELQVSRLNDADSIVHFCIELLIADAASVSLLRQQLCHYYRCPDEMPQKIGMRYADYLFTLDKHQKTGYYRQSLEYWESRFADMPPGPQLPAGRGQAGAKTGRLEALLDGWAVIKAAAAQLDVAPGMVLLTAYAEVLVAWSTGPAFTIVIPGWHRLPIHVDVDNVVGDFTAMSWLVVQRQPATFAQKVCANHRAVQQDLAHCAVSGLKVLRKARAGKSLNFPVVFTDLEPRANVELEAGFLLSKTLSQTAGVDLDNISTDYGDRLGLHWDIAQGRYPDGMAQVMFAAYRHLLTALVDDPESWQATDFDDLINAEGGISGFYVVN